MSFSLYQVDAFANAPFAGNPAAVCLLPTPQPPAWYQNVAAEMNLSETAFLHAQPDGSYRVRWFTPTHEVALCGHATLASAHVLWTEGLLASDAPARFKTESGPLTAQRDGEWITMDFPTDPVTPTEPPSFLLEGLGLSDPVFSGHSERDYFLHCSTAATVHRIDPDMTALAEIDRRGVIVTAPADTDEADFVSRFFAPGVGVPEDPVTGSAHCALGPYWADHTGRTTLVGRQVSDRGGTVRVNLDAPDADRLTLSGQATIVFRGRLDV
jgi:PhzF family phenazine biosynthesis protein